MNLDACEINRWELLRRQLNNLDQQHFQKLQHELPDAVVLDVRTLAEFEAEHLPAAIHMDYFGADLIEKMDALDKSKTYLVYCRSGRRSVRVCVLMRNSGFEKIYNLDGGMKMWV
ncbi:rhodanese-like domain-containing protein [Haliscomenobacter hydrossis]|uniref:Rhodanese-like protein n=1 Tax=Haliscomenobacter hydrossis (strain ATCC 27775 / DSM 1100 / LMG 10767 / O) TaxID=760192 RepID=F4L6K6_HALH1|nr:rhodanese-like domain-containing protein [Haliscomenobacter hydrossis]AEE49849.1 Rhodanese-like protein [Haliscomenobacter hydrossis DSM 1100]